MRATLTGRAAVLMVLLRGGVSLALVAPLGDEVGVLRLEEMEGVRVDVQPPRLRRDADDKRDAGPDAMGDGGQVTPRGHVLLTGDGDVPTLVGNLIATGDVLPGSDDRVRALLDVRHEP